MRTLFLSGAGLSAESGIPTYRGRAGLYTGEFEGLRPEVIVSAAMYASRPDLVLRFSERSRQLIAGAAPNGAHAGIAAWARDNDSIVLTQNIDPLLEAAGCPGVIHLHGKATEVRCLGRAHVHDIAFAPFDPTARCPICNSRMRPNIVLFEERAPEYAKLWSALKKLGPDDAFVVIGTSGEVLDVCEMARKLRCLRIFNALEIGPALDLRHFDLVYRAEATRAWPLIEQSLSLWKRRHDMPRAEMLTHFERSVEECNALSNGS